MATNTSDFFTFSKTAGTAKNLQKPTDGGDNNLWGGYINVDLDTIVGAVNATSDLIADANQNELVDFTATGSAVNHVGITNAATGNGPTIEAKGDDTNIDLNVSGKGTGKLATTSPKITTGINDSNNNELIKVTATGSAVNEITVANAATGNGPTLSATGDDTNIDLNIAGKGTGEIEIASNIAFSNDTDAKVKLPSGGGIYESDGSTSVLTESGGVVTLGSSVLMTGERLLAITTITSTGAYTHNLNALTTHVICWVQAAGGGGGGGDSSTRNGTGGGGGGFCIASLDVVYATDSTLTGSVGAKGTAGPATSGTGGNGGDSTVVWNTSNTITCTGGDGGIRGGGLPQSGGEGRGASVSGFTSILSQLGGRGRSTKNGSYTYGGSDGGDSFLGFGGPGASFDHDAQAGKAYGSGGGGGSGTGGSTKAGAAGADGIIIIYEYI